MVDMARGIYNNGTGLDDDGERYNMTSLQTRLHLKFERLNILVALM